MVFNVGFVQHEPMPTSKFHAGNDAPSIDIKNEWSQNNTDNKVFNLGFNPTSLHVKKKCVCMQTNNLLNQLFSMWALCSMLALYDTNQH